MQIKMNFMDHPYDDPPWSSHKAQFGTVPIGSFPICMCISVLSICMLGLLRFCISTYHCLVMIVSCVYVHAIQLCPVSMSMQYSWCVNVILSYYSYFRRSQCCLKESPKSVGHNQFSVATISNVVNFQLLMSSPKLICHCKHYVYQHYFLAIFYDVMLLVQDQTRYANISQIVDQWINSQHTVSAYTCYQV